MVQRRMPRVQEVVIPLLRAEFPNVMITSWIPDVDHRTFPLLNVRRLGGIPEDPTRLDTPVIELTAYASDGLITTENILLDARTVLYNAVQNQTLTDSGYLHSYFETLGPTQFDSPFEDTWRVQMLIQLGVRPLRNN